MMKKPEVKAFFAAVLAIIGAANADARNTKSTLEKSACPTEALQVVDAVCYTADLPEDHKAPDGARVQIPVAVLKGDNEGAPLFYFPGYPGESVLGYLDDIKTLRDGAGGRDLVLFDYRGSHRASPSLDCDLSLGRLSAYDNIFSPVVYDTAEAQTRFKKLTDYFETCHADLKSSGVAFEHYNDYGVAHDVEAIRKALGYKKIHVAGHSAGGGTILTQARYFPSSVASIIAESPWPTWTRNRAMIDEFYAAREHYLQKLAPFVGERLQGRIFSILDLDKARRALDAMPYMLNAGEETHRFDGAGLFHRLYVQPPKDYKALAALLAAIADGDRSGLRAFIGEPTGTPGAQEGPAPYGLYLSWICGDMGADKLSKTETRAMVQAEPALLGFEVGLACPWWDTEGDVPPEHNSAPVLDIPVLVVTGERDACCGRRMADELRTISPVVQTAEIKGRGHRVLGECRSALVRQFLDNPASPIDKSCTRK
ncbi:MAG: alpha/beta fold hydrolase [Pseudomonadota bacterium]